MRFEIICSTGDERRAVLSDFPLNWVQMTNAIFSQPRSGFGCLQYQDRALIIGGNVKIQGQSNFQNDVWMSMDGIIWANVETAPWSPRSM